MALAPGSALEWYTIPFHVVPDEFQQHRPGAEVDDYRERRPRRDIVRPSGQAVVAPDRVVDQCDSPKQHDQQSDTVRAQHDGGDRGRFLDGAEKQHGHVPVRLDPDEHDVHESDQQAASGRRERFRLLVVSDGKRAQPREQRERGPAAHAMFYQ